RGLDDVTQLIAEKATTITRANYATLRLVDESGQYLRAKAVQGRETKQEYLPIDEHSFTGWVAMRGQAALCPDVKADPHYVAWYPDIKSCMAAPLKRNGQVIGTLYVESTQPAAFSERYQLDLLQSLANQAAIAIENAGLVQELDERAERLVRLQQVTATISAEPSDLTKVLYLITDSLDKIFRGASCAIRLYDSLKDEFGPRVAVGIIQVLVDHPPRPEGTSRHIIQTRIPLYVEDASVIPPNGMPSLRQEVMAVGIKAAAYLPLLLEGETIGILYVDLTEPRQFSQYDTQILELFAYQAAIAIENARKYDELRRTKGLVGSRTALAWMGMVSNTWRHAIEGHAVNILDSLHLLRRNLPTGADDETVEKRLCTIERLARKIQEKPITPPISSMEGVESVCVNTLVRERVQQLWQYPPHNAVACQWNLARDEEVTVRASSEWLRRALDILLDNAVEAMEGSQVKELTVLTRRADGRVQVTVADTGPGIPPEVGEQLFDRPVKNPEGRKGLVLGLSMALMIGLNYGGDIYVGHTGPGGTSIVLELPTED
ncbi:MAG: GAF domain-containing protein, partial [Anaerolineae bacterium]